MNKCKLILKFNFLFDSVSDVNSILMFEVLFVEQDLYATREKCLEAVMAPVLKVWK
jgi:hypothetical protein